MIQSLHDPENQMFHFCCLYFLISRQVVAPAKGGLEYMNVSNMLSESSHTFVV